MELVGSLEEIVLMILLRNEKINSVEIAKEYYNAMGRNLSIPSIHVTLKRMQKKGWVKSEFGNPTSERGGRRKRIYWATPQAYEVLNELTKVKSKLWNGITKPSLQYVNI